MIGAVDIGGTKTLVAVFDHDGNIVEQQKFPTPKDYDDFKAELAKVVATLSTDDFSFVVVAAPGLLNRKTGVGVAFGNLPWKSVPLQHDVERIFQAPTRIENDAKLAALAEAKALGDYHKVLYVTISTGIGAGLIIDGQIDPDFENIEIGQITLEHKGKYQLWEDFASGRAIVAMYGKKAAEIDDPKAWAQISKNIAEGLINAIATLTPDAIVIGGGVGNHLEKFQDTLEADLEAFKTPVLTIPPVFKAKHPEEAVIYGCYEYAKQHHAKIHA